MAHAAGAEAVVVVLRRDEDGARPRRRQPSVHVRVHEMRVHEVGRERAYRGRGSAGEPGIEVARALDALERDVPRGQRLVERLGRGGACVVEAEEGRVDPPRAERGQELQLVPLRAADPSDALDVEDLH